MPPTRATNNRPGTSANLGFEAQLWQTANALALGEQFKESAKLEKEIAANLKGLGFDI